MVLRRRTLLQGALAGAVLTGCSKPPVTPTVSPDNPFTVDGSAPVDVVVSEEYGGFAAAAYRKKYAGATISPKLTTQLADDLLPRFATGTPPDVVLSTGDAKLELGRLVKDNQLTDLQQLLDAPSWDDQSAKVKDQLLPDVLEVGQFDGTQRTLNYISTVYGIWYSASLFQRNGWDVPRTWPELLALGVDMKAAGLGPFIYAGTHPYYLLELVLTLAAKTGGPDVTKRIDNLEDGAWTDESITRAITAVGELTKRGLLAPGTAQYDHIGSQKRFLASKAGMLPCGNWLENEMKGLVKDEFALTVFAVPPLDSSPAMASGLHVAATAPFFVPEKAKNKAGGLEYLRTMLSKEAAGKFTELTGSPTIVKGATEGIKLSPGAASSDALIKSGGTNNWTTYFASWYSPMDKPSRSIFAELAAARITPDEFCNQMQKLADDTAKDPNTKKQSRS